jgi:hypothetical protein
MLGYAVGIGVRPEHVAGHRYCTLARVVGSTLGTAVRILREQKSAPAGEQGPVRHAA